MKEHRKISGEIYLVIDPSMNEKELLKKLSATISADIAAVQIWDNFALSVDQLDLVEKVCELCHPENVPVLLNNNWRLVNSTSVDGVHFDAIPTDFQKIKKEIGSDCFMGITVNNDLSVVRWAEENDLDYISFCSIFPSVTSNSCELVSFKTIQETRQITSMPIFLAGGIIPENIITLKELDFQGVAVVSGIMSSEEPLIAAQNYLKELKQIKNENKNYR